MRPKKTGELETACCNIPALPKATELQKFQVGTEQKASISNTLLGTHVCEQHLERSASPKALGNPSMPKAGTSCNRQGVFSSFFYPNLS